ncbi:hypothetical protein CTA2_7156 [Colletotrichum tanaceti]|uniref:Uncharacterized protein n=1 Tax=Colletotrichum tanaceti TaxID=1306861 RepID=A0A4V6DHE1_9PEZI|nr:hypothetical protein CTA2_7156 [Colletotrichum tanaceti]TKW56216.1 hypothetical protein CTA1_6211 [Colletotrichum tanaceti]
MDHETVLFAVDWKDGEWPFLDVVRGTITGPPLPPDVVDFPLGSVLPRHFFWRPPKTSLFAISIDLGIVNSQACSGPMFIPRFRSRVEASGKPNITVP